MQRCLSTSTMPSARLKEAPVGHTSTHGGCSQCWHIIGRDSLRPLPISLISILRIHCESVVPMLPDKPFSWLHAVTQSLQPSLHCAVSISMPQRVLLETASEFPCAISNNNIPGAIATAAAPSEDLRKPLRRGSMPFILYPSAARRFCACRNGIRSNQSSPPHNDGIRRKSCRRARSHCRPWCWHGTRHSSSG